ncbi:MAG: peptidyl-prolyl cis-trans isomerase [Deltaproteobacteria bacterium]|nr:peptidyl-prolyl cis-trans isomerase [Deltaproteobacteria bacterium]
MLANVTSRMALAAALAALLISCSRDPAPRSDADVVVAQVDGAPISLKDLKNEIAAQRGLAPAADSGGAAPSISTKSAGRREAQEALRLLIERSVVLAEGERLGIAVSGAEVEKEVERFRADFPPGGLEKAIIQTGRDMESWRRELARSLLYRKSAAAIADSRASVTREEVEQVFRRREREFSRPERIRVRQFLFDSEENARTARGKILEGEGPDKVVERFSSGDVRPTAADLGEVTREDLPEEIAAELFSLNEGGVSGIVPREGSYSLFVVVRKEPAHALSLAAAAPEIREGLLRSRREDAFRSWLRAKVGKADIRVQETLLDRMTEGGK